MVLRDDDFAGLVPAVRRELIRIEQQKAIDTCRRNRARVLAHPDLAARLTQPPVNYPTPEMWGGYIPAEWAERYNNSPIRRALVALMRDVDEREAGSW